MSAGALAIHKTGFVSAVGFTSPASCAAIRAGVTNPTESGVVNAAGEWILGHAVDIDRSLRGTARLAQLAILAITDCLDQVDSSVCLLLCVAERDRPGRLPDLENELFARIELGFEAKFSEHSRVIPQGRAGIASAIALARRMLDERRVSSVLVAAADSFLAWDTLAAFEQKGRLLNEENSNGFIPGEGAAAFLLSRDADSATCFITGVGVGSEPSTIESEVPLRGEGMAQAIRAAASNAGCELHEIDSRIADMSGEQYYFKEATLAASRVFRHSSDTFDLWHPAECIGECGAALGAALIVVAEAALRKGYAPGPTMLVHWSNDDGMRAAAIVQRRSG